MLNIRQRQVKAGAKFLDKNVKDWYKRINVDRINMRCFASCILGQLYSEYSVGKRKLFSGSESVKHDKAVKLGFYSWGNEHELNVYWREEVKDRLLKQKKYRVRLQGYRYNLSKKQLLDIKSRIEKQLSK